ncbi:hypothetical protein SCP_0201820 [Sparassis crispa]|uniref:Coilin n=1 Tax=Sparassis crispa TaxID=139825 RepID=A0A401G9Z3_9APHY|nr:hypothetical protein SCP_0201820 [Sparassis crispa]GBE78985.1 hypothetical protein SCP_0201820 [Sparassis crispa]
MRVKIESVAPLPTVKAWYSVHSVSSVSEMKARLCSELQPFHGRVRAQDIVLVLEDFELLDSSPIDVVRDGDLIVVRHVPAVSFHKRKASTDEAGPVRKRSKHPSDTTPLPPVLRAASRKLQLNVSTKRAAIHADASLTSDSESTSSSESESESESKPKSDSSSSDSDSNSSDGSSSSSSASARAGMLAVTKAKVGTPAERSAPATHKSNQRTETRHVPPGEGKPGTHNRNIRRRRKRMYERLAATAEPASVNAIPLGSKVHSLVPSQRETTNLPRTEEEQSVTPSNEANAAPAFMMASLQNKNKRRGFKNALAFGVPAKIVFSSPEEVSADTARIEVGAAQDVLPFSRAQGNEVADAIRSTSFVRLVPPSEKEERGQLPPNMFITSVDVEEGLPAKKRKKQSKVKAWEKDATAEDSYLPYDEPDEALGADTMGASAGCNSVTESQLSPSFDRGIVEGRWSSLTKITAPAQLQVGCKVAWKALGINPNTFTPEMLLNVGRVVSYEDQLVVKPLEEHGAVEVSFGGLVVGEDSGSVEERYDWQDVLQADWRLVAYRVKTREAGAD